jgi:hypothetical protein
MLRNVAQPGDAEGLRGTEGVEAAGDGAVEDGLLCSLSSAITFRFAG